MKLSLIPLALLLASCAHSVPDIGQTIPPKVPDLPADLSRRADRLPPLTDPTLEGLQRDAVTTDRAYNDVAGRLNSVLDVYECVKKAINSQKAVDCRL